MNKYVKSSILIGLITLVSALLIFLVIDFPSPYIAALIIAFVVFEISFYHLFVKERQKRRPL
ncbi:hypothetical protein [Halobacillus sp. A5]|uniref:hypothetical protein n=1 Tax=Halobacillus sp. A5 TaxID=2880263 RepID=UPI0020A6CE62|nr:hypothetical protein [Halobacillus sp. A5]MCP3028526.1 hypothetical protein [Halobacillus sp. A5]